MRFYLLIEAVRDLLWRLPEAVVNFLVGGREGDDGGGNTRTGKDRSLNNTKELAGSAWRRSDAYKGIVYRTETQDKILGRTEDKNKEN